jgi:transcriptional regulator with XRE-family HTH domain
VNPLQLLALRRFRGWTQVEAGAAFGVSSLTVSRWERGVQPIPRWAGIIYLGLVPGT